MTDHAIITQVLAGDIEAFARLVERHYDRSARIALRILGNAEDAEEAVQDAFVRAFRALATYEERERFSAWLTRILVNQCRTVRAKSERRDAMFAPFSVDSVHAFAPSAESHDLHDVERALAQLPLEQREAIVLRYADDLTFEEMSRITGVGTSALKMRVQRAFTRLRALLLESSRV